MLATILKQYNPSDTVCMDGELLMRNNVEIRLFGWNYWSQEKQEEMYEVNVYNENITHTPKLSNKMKCSS